jgi:hypothetical protein
MTAHAQCYAADSTLICSLFLRTDPFKTFFDKEQPYVTGST